MEIMFIIKEVDALVIEKSLLFHTLTIVMNIIIKLNIKKMKKMIKLFQKIIIIYKKLMLNKILEKLI